MREERGCVARQQYTAFLSVGSAGSNSIVKCRDLEQDFQERKGDVYHPSLYFRSILTNPRREGDGGGEGAGLYGKE